MPRRRTRWWPDGADDRGETLVEVLVSVVILGVAGVAILAGLQMSVAASDIHRKQTTGGAYARSYAEAIEQYVASAAGHYVPCAAAGAYAPATVGFTGLPGGYTVAQSAALRVPPGGGAAGACAANDTGVQQVQITITSPGPAAKRVTEQLTILLRKPCGASMAVCT